MSSSSNATMSLLILRKEIRQIVDACIPKWRLYPVGAPISGLLHLNNVNYCYGLSLDLRRSLRRILTKGFIKFYNPDYVSSALYLSHRYFSQPVSTHYYFVLVV